MRNSLLKIAALAFVMLGGTLCSYSQMSDENIIEYVKKESENGKSQQQIVNDLLKKGVQPSQLKRLMDKYNKQNSNKTNAETSTSSNRLREPQDRESALQRQNRNSQTSNSNKQSINKQSSNQQDKSDFLDIARDQTYFGNEDDVLLNYQIVSPQQEEIIFGHNIFANDYLTFEPNPNLATPKNYKLGPGDEIYIDIWGESEDHINETISPEGAINVPQIGPIYLNGLTIDQANNYLKQLFSSKYAGLSNEDTQVNVTLGNIRSITVNVMGEVENPGTLTLSPFSSVFSALYQAGGVNQLGSLRNIRIIREGKPLTTIDLYDYIFQGKQSLDIRLLEGDVIIVPPYTSLINIEGNVKRPMYYEMLPNESISKLIEYAGGFAGNAYTDLVTISRNNNIDNVIYNVPNENYASFQLQDGDVVSVSQVNDRFQNRIDLRGAVLRPGFYAIDNNVNTIGKLMRKTDGLLENAFTDRVLIYRQADDLSLEIVPVNLSGILKGTTSDVKLKRNDMIVVSSITEVFDSGTLTIQGAVNNPGTYQYAINATIEDLIVMAGGLRQGASLVRADVARRVIAPYSTMPSDTISNIYSFSIKDGLVVDGDRSFKLLPYDIVQIRMSPGYSNQKIVTVMGEVPFEGQYALQNRNERVSQLVKRCGGVNPSAFIKGASLIRTMTEDEIIARDESIKLAQSTEEDSIATSKLILSDTYAVGIDLEAAMANPGSYYDIVLRPGDVLNIPEQQTTVKISGDVMSPTVTTFVPGKKYKYYVDKAGGFGERARKNKAFIVYMNGQVEKLKGSTVIEPGSQIIVPSKPKSGGTNWAQVVSLTSSFATLGTMVATLYNIFK